MNIIFRNKNITRLVALVLVLTAGCNNILEEQPRGQLVPSFFETAQGIESGLVSAYALNRYFYGTEGGLQITEGYGTDCWYQGQQVNNPALAIYTSDGSNNAIQPNEGALLSLWNWAYPAINTCNGIIDFGSNSTDIAETTKTQLIAEARFIRAHWYFLLVQQFGGVTLDLGSGPLKFNTSTVSNQSRASSAEVWDAIIADLEAAVAGLPGERPSQRGRAWKATALHVLAKAYLTRGWSADAKAGDFQNAYDNALDLIQNAGAYGVALLPDFADVHREGNEGNAEILWTIERNQDINYTPIDGFNDPDNSQNRSNFFFRSFYEQDDDGANGDNRMIRDVENGRPWIRYKPTPWLLDVAFGNPADTRYLKSFQTVYIGNNPESVAYGDTAIWFVPKYMADAISDKTAFLAQPGRWGVWFPDAPGHITLDGQRRSLNEQNKHYPSLTKFNATSRPSGVSPTDANTASSRPFIVYRFAETYLIAAEAYLKSATGGMDAVTLVNEIRRRAADGSTVLDIDATFEGKADPIDFILDERARELCGEQMRWMDLTRTRKLIERVHATEGTGEPAVYNRQWNNGAPTYVEGRLPARPLEMHYLRPIPLTTIDNVSSDYGQNLGYN